MPDVISCHFCNKPVSRRAMYCGSCGAEISPLPDAITHEFLDSLRDEDVPDLMFQYASHLLEESGCYRIDGPSDASVLAKLPRGLRSAYTLVVLDSEVRNGGFYQWFTNSSGKITRETLDDLRLIGAASHVQLVEQAIRLNQQLETKYPPNEEQCHLGNSDGENEWDDIEANFLPEFDQLSSNFYQLEDTDSLWNYFRTYARANHNECVHRRS